MSSKQCKTLEDLLKEVTLKPDDIISKATIKSIFRGCKDRNRKNGVEAPRILAQMTLGRVKQQQKLKNKLIAGRRNIFKEDDTENIEEKDVLAWKKFMASKEIDEVDLLNKCRKILYLNPDDVTVVQKLADGSIKTTNTILVPLDTKREILVPLAIKKVVPCLDNIQKFIVNKEVDEVDLTGKCKKIVYINQHNDNITVVQKLHDGTLQRINTSLIPLNTNAVELHMDTIQKFMANKEVDEVDLTGKCKKIVYLNQHNDNITVVQKLEDGSIQRTNTSLVRTSLCEEKLASHLIRTDEQNKNNVEQKKYKGVVDHRNAQWKINHRNAQWKINQTLWKASKFFPSEEKLVVSTKRKFNDKLNDQSKRRKIQDFEVGSRKDHKSNVSDRKA